VTDDGFEPGRWWRVLRDGQLWCETSREAEARDAADQPGDVLQNLYRRVDEEWRDV
jgi:uncharacterized protein (DUF2237 family)